MSRELGQHFELKAQKFLENKGLVLLENNYSCRWGEIDLIMRDKNYLVFVEVRARKSATYGDAASSITRSKQQKIIKTAQYYLMTNQLHDKYPVRFDVISVQSSQSAIEWIPNAFVLH